MYRRLSVFVQFVFVSLIISKTSIRFLHSTSTLSKPLIKYQPAHAFLYLMFFPFHFKYVDRYHLICVNSISKFCFIFFVLL